MMIKGSTMVGYQPLGDHPNFFRMITSNPASTCDDVDFLLHEIERLAESLDFEKLVEAETEQNGGHEGECSEKKN